MESVVIIVSNILVDIFRMRLLAVAIASFVLSCQTLIYSILFPIELPTELQINGVNKCAGKRNRLRWLMKAECLERVDSLTSSHCYRSRARPTLSMHKTVLCKASKRPMEWKRATTTQIHSIYRSNTLSWRFHMIGGGFP